MTYQHSTKRLAILFGLALCSIILMLISLSYHLSYAHAANKPRPTIALNIQRGPLGVLLNIQGKNLHPGLASIGYIDALHTRGSFAPPGSSSVQVARNGTFTAINELLPASGPKGAWTIVVVDSAGTTVTASYQALSSAAPTLTINPTSGRIGDIIAFSGSNWLPQGTKVMLHLMGTAHSSLLSTPVISDKNGSIMGAFHLPPSLDLTLLTAAIIATDSDDALQAQVTINVLPPASSLTPVITTTPMAVPTHSHSGVTTQTAPDSSPLISFNSQAIAFIFLFVGSILGLAALMLILFMLPWSEQVRSSSLKHTGDTTQMIRKWW